MLGVLLSVSLFHSFVGERAMVKPQGRRPSSSFSESSPQFFKIYWPQQCSHSLKIPPDFVKYLNKNMGFNSTIRSDVEERSWQVGVTKDNGKLFFREGWHQFTLDNSLEFGDFLIFYYGGNGNFLVKKYGKNGIRKVIDAPRRNLQEKENHIVGQGKSERAEFEVSRKEIRKKTSCPRVPMVIPEVDKSFEAANSSLSGIPFFKVVMTTSYINACMMNIPSSFQTTHMKNDTDIQSVILLISDKKWPVKLIKWQKYYRFSSGWLKFCKEHALKVGDVCVFELIEKNDFILRVTIFSC